VVFQDWQSFYVLVGTAAATLVGLMFVAISVGSRVITAKDLPALRVCVSPIVVQFFSVLATSAVVLLPTLSPMLLGILFVVAGLISCGLALAGLPVMRRSNLDVQEWTWYLLVPGLSYLLLVGTGIGLLLRAGQAPSGLAVATILLLIAGIRNAWDLVIFRLLPRGELPRLDSAGDLSPPGGSTATPKRRADSVPQPSKEPQADAASRQSIALSSSQQADVVRMIQDAGLQLRDFTWALQPSRYALIGPPVSALFHTRTGCFFRFEFTQDARRLQRMSVFIPRKGGREVTKSAASWDDQLAQVRQWLGRLQ